MGKKQLLCAILTADTVSWFQLHSATSAKPVEAQVVANGDIRDAPAYNDLLNLDSKYLETAYTKLYWECTVKLHVYGVRPSTPAQAQTDSGPSQPFKAAIADAIHTAADDLCSLSTVLLAKSPSGGNDLAIIAQRPKLHDSCGTPTYLCMTHERHVLCLQKDLAQRTSHERILAVLTLHQSQACSFLCANKSGHTDKRVF